MKASLNLHEAASLMATTSPPPDIIASSSSPPSTDDEPKFGGFTRFEIELEFVQCLSSPHYLCHLATLSAPTSTTTTTANNLITASASTSSTTAPTPAPRTHNSPNTSKPATATSTAPTTSPTPLLQHPPFIAYLAYLRYFATPPYIQYLTYPGPTLKSLELLQSERFRREILSPDVVAAMVREGVEAAERWNC